MRRLLIPILCLVAGCPVTNTPTDAFMRDAGPPDPDASMNCRASAIVPSGTYWVGTDSRPGFGNNWPAHQVTLSRDGWVARYESTNACYRACMAAGGCADVLDLMPDSRLPAYIDREPAMAYCAWLGGRLLTEAEWEVMARGADGRLWPWYPAPDDPRRPEAGPLGDTDICVLADTSPSGRCPGYLAQPVGSGAPRGRGPFGHEDVVTNANEWVLGTLVFPYPSELQVDPILEGGDYPVGRAAPVLRDTSGETARCLFTSPPEPLYVEE